MKELQEQAHPPFGQDFVYLRRDSFIFFAGYALAVCVHPAHRTKEQIMKKTIVRLILAAAV